MRNISLWAVLALMSCSQQQESILPKETALVASVYASVTVQPDSLYYVYANAQGLLYSRLVEEGQIVAAQTPLFKITNTTPELQLAQARERLSLAESQYSGRFALLHSLEKEIETQRLKYKNDSLNYHRQKNLWQQQIGSKAELESRELQFKTSKNQLRLLEERKQQTEVELRHQVLLAQNQMATARVASEEYLVRAIRQAKVYALYKEPGEYVTPQQPLAMMGSAERFVLELRVDEVDIVSVELGQTVYIHLDAYPGQTFTAIVTKIYPQKEERNQTFKVEALFENVPPTLYAGLSGEANIKVSYTKSALVIPKRYLRAGSPAVKTDDGWKEVTTGIQTLDSIEITSGIDKNTRIYLPE